jgi:hypothetical protein
MDHLKSNNEFYDWINELKRTIKSARQKLAATINSQVLEIYWEIGTKNSSAAIEILELLIRSNRE